MLLFGVIFCGYLLPPAIILHRSSKAMKNLLRKIKSRYIHISSKFDLAYRARCIGTTESSLSQNGPRTLKSQQEPRVRTMRSPLISVFYHLPFRWQAINMEDLIFYPPYTTYCYLIYWNNGKECLVFLILLQKLVLSSV